MQNLEELQNEARLEKLERAKLITARKKAWPERHLIGKDGKPVPFHKAQELVFDSKRRSTAFVAGSQVGKTSFTPWWLWDAIQRSGSGDYIAVTSSFDLFRLKFLPSLLQAYEEILKVGRYWAGDKVIEIADPMTGEFLAKRATDHMWARIILRSAQSLGGLESATALAAVLDEAGQPEFPLDAYRAIRRRLLLNRGRMLFTTTLYDLGWVVSEIIIPAKKNPDDTKVMTVGDAEIEYTDSAATDTCLVQADSVANPVFPRQEYDEAKVYLPPDQFAMQFRGRVERPRHMIYDCFDEERHLEERFDIPHEWPRYMGIDFGGANLAAVFIAVEPKTGKAYIYREYTSGNQSAEGHVSDLMFGEPGRPVAYGGAKAEGQWRTEFRQAGLPIREPKVADVWLGINIVYGALKEGYFLDGRPTGITRVVIFDDLTKLQTQLNSYRRKTDDQGNPIPEEIVAKNSYHLLDALRYVAPAIFKSHTVMIATV